MTRQPSAIVVGAGLAGLTASIDLLDAGWQVTLVERRPEAGGRTFSYTTEEDDLLDNGQHVFLGCCTAYLDLLRKLGCLSQVYLQDRLEVNFLDRRWGRARLAAARLPAPLHLLPSFLRFRYLDGRDKLAALWTLLLLRFHDLPDNQSFEEWLIAHGQSANSIERFWNLIIVPTCNAPAARVSARQGGFVFREGLLRRRLGANLGYPRVGLSQVLPQPAIRYLQSGGAAVELGINVRSCICMQNEVEAVTTTQNRRLKADAYILAVPSHELSHFSLGSWVEPATRLSYAPIVGLNLWYDQAVFEGEVLCVIVDGEAFWLFDGTRITGQHGPEHQIVASISAAEDIIDVPREDVAAQVAAKLAKALPAAKLDRLVRWRVSKIRRATFVPAPGSQDCRFGPITPLRNLFLAGAWTNTGWPETMESAVRSGHAAASAARQAAGGRPVAGSR